MAEEWPHFLHVAFNISSSWIQHYKCWIQLDKMLDIACGKSGHSSALLNVITFQFLECMLKDARQSYSLKQSLVLATYQKLFDVPLLSLPAAKTHKLSEECEMFLWLRENGLDYYFSNFVSGNFHTLRDIASIDLTAEVFRELEVQLPAHRKRLRLASKYILYTQTIHVNIREWT